MPRALFTPVLPPTDEFNLGQQRGGDLDERQPTQSGGGGEPGEVADHATAERDYRGAPLNPSVQQLIHDVQVGIEAFRTLAAGDDNRAGDNRGLRQPVHQRRQMQVGHGPVGDHHSTLLRQSRSQQGSCAL